jgi:hypothetical protein
VLADFFSEYAKLAGVPADVKSGRADYRNIPTELREPVIAQMRGTDFFYRLPKFASADRLVNMVVQVFGYYNICSSPLRGDNQNSEAMKRAWIAENLDPQPRVIRITGRKGKYAKQADGTPNILVDDRNTVLTEWEQSGGIGIKYQADEDGLDTVASGLRRAFEIIKGKRKHTPQNIQSRDYGRMIAGPGDSKKTNEAGEPANPSRRGFLRALGAAGAAAAMPGAAVQALAAPAAAAAEVPAAVAAGAINPATIAALWKAATSVGAKEGYEFDRTMYGYRDPELAHMDEYDGEWMPGENDLHTAPQGESGTMPWGSDYRVRTTPGGIPVIVSGVTNTMVQYTFIRDGKTYWYQYYGDGGGEGIEATNIPGLDNFDYDQYSKDADDANKSKHWDTNLTLIDDIVSGAYKKYIPDTHSDKSQLPPKDWDELSPDEQKQRDKEWDDWEEQQRSKLQSKKDTSPLDLARLAGLAKQGYNKLTGKKAPAAPTAQPPQALPAPTKPEFDLTPDLRQKQAEPAKRKDKDNASK